MQRVGQVQWPTHLVPSRKEHVVSDSCASLVIHGACGLISDPAMNTSSAWEDPEEWLEPEVLGESLI